MAVLVALAAQSDDLGMLEPAEDQPFFQKRLETARPRDFVEAGILRNLYDAMFLEFLVERQIGESVSATAYQSFHNALFEARSDQGVLGDHVAGRLLRAGTPRPGNYPCTSVPGRSPYSDPREF